MIELPPETRDLFYPCTPTRVEGETYSGIAIGRDLGALVIVLDSGPVVAGTDRRLIPINSSLDQYREALAVVGGIRDELASNPEDEGLIANLEEQLRKIDLSSLEVPGSYWSLVLEQIRDEQF